MNTAGVGSESQEQQALFQWWTLACRKFGVPEATMFAIPNGGARSVITGARLKREGVRAGIPDVFLAVPRGQWHGLFLELKRCGKQSRVSQAQRAVLATLKQAGYQVAVAHGVSEGVDVVTEYLEEGER